MAKLDLPEPREYGWTLKRLRSAKTSVRRDSVGGIDIEIEHETVHGVSAAMLAWWFQHLDKELVFRGEKIPVYLLWHPYDHVSVEGTRDDAGKIAPGSTIHLHEVFGRDPRFVFKEALGVHRWDAGGIGLHLEVPGLRLFQVDHAFRDVEGGARYHTRAHIGAPGVIGALANAVLIPLKFDDDKIGAWLTHNVEEVGNFENFLPELCASMGVKKAA